MFRNPFSPLLFLWRRAVIVFTRSWVSRSAVLITPAITAAGISTFDPTAPPDEQREIVERIRGLMGSSDDAGHDQVVQKALSRLRDELRSERREGVLEDIRREIAFRKWCEESTADHANHAEDPWKIKL